MCISQLLPLRHRTSRFLFLLAAPASAGSSGTAYLSSSPIRSTSSVDGTLLFCWAWHCRICLFASNSTNRFFFFSLPPLLQYPTRHKHSCLIIHRACMTAYPPNLGPRITHDTRQPPHPAPSYCFAFYAFPLLSFVSLFHFGASSKSEHPRPRRLCSFILTSLPAASYKSSTAKLS